MRYSLETILKKDGKFFTGDPWYRYREIEIETDLDLSAYEGQRIQTINEYLPDNKIRIYHAAPYQTAPAIELAANNDPVYWENILQLDGSLKWHLVAENGCCGWTFDIETLKKALRDVPV